MAPGTVVGVDVGGTFLRAAAVAANGRVRRRLREPVAKERGPDALLDQIADAVRTLAAGRGRAAGVGVAGALDLRGRMTHAPHLPTLDGVDVAGGLRRRLRGFRVAVENDANAFLVGEAWKGAARGARVAVGLTLGTGVGGALLLDGALVRGAHGFAGEWGHMVVERGGAACACGSRGCLEAYVSGTALAAQVRDAAAAEGVEVDPTPSALFAASRRGEAWARRLARDTADRLGAALGALANALDPDLIVLGGGVARAWPALRARTLAALRRHAMRGPARVVRVVRSALGDDAALLGAARLASARPRRAGVRRRQGL